MRGSGFFRRSRRQDTRKRESAIELFLLLRCECFRCSFRRDFEFVGIFRVMVSQPVLNAPWIAVFQSREQLRFRKVIHKGFAVSESIVCRACEYFVVFSPPIERHAADADFFTGDLDYGCFTQLLNERGFFACRAFCR